MKKPINRSNPQPAKLIARNFGYFLFFCFWSLSLQAQTYTFTTAGATGTIGPTQAMLNTAYLSTNLSGSVTMVGAGVQSFTIPQSGTYRIHAFGASGGYNGGYGANSVGDFTLTSGTVLKIVVGQVGSTAINGQNRGSGGGGGGSFVATITNSPLVVAGGGGGYGDGYTSTTTNTPVCCIPELNASLNSTANPCPGGSNNGINGNGGSCGVNSAGAGGGFYTNGAGCTAAVPAAQFIGSWGPLGGWCVAGSGIGGYGGGGGGYNSANGNRGGGGGGYSGGGGGDTPTSTVSLAVGGGGSTYNAGINVLTALNTFTGDGRVIIESVCLIQLAAQGLGNFGNTICSGNSVTLSTSGLGTFNWSNGSTGTNTIVVSPSVTTIYTVSALSMFSCMGNGSIQINVNPSLPTLTISSSSPSICLGDSLTLNAGGALSYSWSIPGNITSASPLVKPSVSTSYSVTGYNACGSIVNSISVQVVPLPIVALLSAPLICQTESVSLSISSTANNYTILPANITGTNTLYSLNPFVSTVYTVSGSSGVCRGSITTSITVLAQPTINLSATSTQLCNGNSATLTAAGGATYTWNTAGASGNIAVVTPTTSTYYTIFGSGTNGCKNYDSVFIYVKPNPVVSLSQNAGLICLGKTATLSASGAQTYTWMPGNIFTPSFITSPPANTLYTCTGTSSIGCTDTKTLSLAVFNPSVSVSSPPSICSGNTATIQAGSAFSYSWNGQVGASLSIVSPTINSVYILSVVNYSLTVPCNYSVAISIAVNPSPEVNIINASTNRCAGETNRIVVSGANTYSLNGVSTASTIILSLLSNTIINIVGEDQEGCMGTASLAVFVNECVGIEEMTRDDKIIVFPNPTKGAMTVIGVENELIVMDLQGREVLSVRIDSASPVKIDRLAPGIYLLYQQNVRTQFLRKIVVLAPE